MLKILNMRMKPVTLALLTIFILSALVISTAVAQPTFLGEPGESPPETIVVGDISQGGHASVTIIFEEGSTAPPDLGIKSPHGSRPAENIPPPDPPP